MNLVEVITTVAPYGLVGLLTYSLYIGLKFYTVHMVCKHPKLTDEQVKALTTMVSRNKHPKF